MSIKKKAAYRKLTTESGAVILWFRRDLRLADNPALTNAISWAREHSSTVIPVFIWAPEEEQPWSPGAASNWWLHHSLERLKANLEALGSTLVIRSGPTLQALGQLVRETNATAMFWNRLYEPAIWRRDEKIKDHFKAQNTQVESFNANLLIEPWDLASKASTPYQVFTPFWKALQESYQHRSPLPTPGAIPSPYQLSSLEVTDLNLLPRINWSVEIQETWSDEREPGEDAGLKALKFFVSRKINDYCEGRNAPAEVGTSRMSPYLHFGEISPRQIWNAVQKKKPNSAQNTVNHSQLGSIAFLREIGWREFAHHLLFHFPHTTTEPLRVGFKKFPWKSDAKALTRWQKGMTGYPIVDAGMRELWQTGWMHNRVRMIVGSFLVKDLLIPWQAGAQWFWDTLVDADLANNTLGWQWIAGCGADAAPYFRVFNPITQGEKFDPLGVYTRKYVPQIASIPDKYLQRPFSIPNPSKLSEIPQSTSPSLPSYYPLPIIDHQEARTRALFAYETTKK